MNAKKVLWGAVSLVAGWSTVAVAATAYAPLEGRVICASGSLSSFLDITNDLCSEWNHRAMIGGSRYYSYYGGCATSCTGGTSCNGGAGNYYVTSGANGWEFRQLFFNANVSSGSKTCDRCALGLLGATGIATTPLARSDNRQYGTRKSAWIANVSCGQTIPLGGIVGYPTL